MKYLNAIMNIFFYLIFVLFFSSCSLSFLGFEKAPASKENLISDPPVRKPALHDKKEKNKSSINPVKGNASYYKKLPSMSPLTASGEPFDDQKMTAAHPVYPFGTKLKVTNLANDKSVVVRVNDRGPFSGDRIIDISLAAAKKINMLDAGITLVSIEELSQ
jgi:rare lipoprotein A (peptidoglycan hydrolase)